MTSIYQMVSAQPGLIPQVTGDITHTRLYTLNVFVDQYYENFYDKRYQKGSYTPILSTLEELTKKAPWVDT